MKAFRILVNRSATWADWEEELVALELQELDEAGFDLSLTGFDIGEIDDFLPMAEKARTEVAPPPPKNPVSRLGDLWLCGKHRMLCGDATRPEDVERLLDGRQPILMVADPPYGIELDSEWRDRAGLNGCGPAEPSYLKHRTVGHIETTISGDTRADWSEAFALAVRNSLPGDPPVTNVRGGVRCGKSGAGNASRRITKRRLSRTRRKGWHYLPWGTFLLLGNEVKLNGVRDLGVHWDRV